MNATETFTLRRLVRACLLGLVLFLFAGGLVGLAAAGEPETQLPERFGVPAPWVGDRGEYNFTVVQRTGDVFQEVVPEETIARFEWLPPRDILDADGRPYRVNDLRYASRGLYGGNKIGVTGLGPGDLDAEKAGFVYGYDVKTGRLVGYGLRADRPDAHENMMILLREGDSTSRMPLCGIRNPLQGVSHDTDDAVRLFFACNIEQRGGFEASFRAYASETVDGRDCVVYARKGQTLLLGWDRSEIYVWMCEGIPYPVRIAVEHAHLEDRFSVYRLASWSRGDRPLDGPDATPAKRGTPPLEFAARERWGPSDAGVNHPFPLSQAYRVANVPGSPMTRFLASHPDAYVMQAEYRQTRLTDAIERHWWFVLTDGIDVLPIGVVQETHGSDVRLRYENQTERAQTQLAGSYAPADALPDRLPTVASLEAWWRAYRLSDRSIDADLGWSFVIRPTHHACAQRPEIECAALTTMWVGKEAHPDTGWHEYRPLDWSKLQVSVAPDGQSAQARSLSERPDADASWRSARPLGVRGANAFQVDVGLWRLPSGGLAVGAGVAAVGLGLVYWAWPMIKSVLGFGLFSRVERPQALDAAARRDLHDAVTASPGIHFQELRRRLGWSPGRLQHHLAYLVRLGLLSEVRTDGYSCYHVAGSLDRRVAQAMPALKAPGARAVLQAVLQSGPIGLQQLAHSSGLDPATVHYHVGRLAEAGLLRRERRGRLLIVEPLAPAKDALAAAS